MIPLPADLLDKLNLGPHFEATPISYSWVKAQMMTNAGARTLHVLVIEDGSGRHGYVLDPDSLSEFARKATHEATGLVIASP